VAGSRPLHEIPGAGRLNEIPTNHSPRFAPVIHPTLQDGRRGLDRRGSRLAGAIGLAMLLIGSIRECKAAGIDLRGGCVRLRVPRRAAAAE